MLSDSEMLWLIDAEADTDALADSNLDNEAASDAAALSEID